MTSSSKASWAQVYAKKTTKIPPCTFLSSPSERLNACENYVNKKVWIDVRCKSKIFDGATPSQVASGNNEIVI